MIINGFADDRGRLRMTIFCTVLFMYRPATGRELTGSTIRESIGKHILYETAIAPGQVDIKVNDGIVMLSGTVNNLLRKDRVRQIAESIRGVRSVVNTVARKTGRSRKRGNRSGRAQQAPANTARSWDGCIRLCGRWRRNAQRDCGLLGAQPAGRSSGPCRSKGCRK